VALVSAEAVALMKI